MFKPGDKVQHKATGELATVLRHEEATGNLRLEGHNEAQWHRADHYQPAPAPAETDPEIPISVEVESDPFPHTPPGPEMGQTPPPPAVTVPETPESKK